jgi:hypothetical protein
MRNHRVDESGPTERSLESCDAASFAVLFKNLRKQLVGKQACLSAAGLRCTDAAISHWERGLRLPRPRTMRNAIEVLVHLGATPADIEQLTSAWKAEYGDRKRTRRLREPGVEGTRPTAAGGTRTNLWRNAG